MLSVWPCKKKDAIKYYEEQIHIHNVLYDKALEDYYNSNTGFGFVVLRTQSDRDYVLNNFATSDTTLNAHSWILKIAPAPREIKWENLNLDLRYMSLYRCLMFIAFLLVFLIFMTPLVFLNYMTIILQDLNLYQLLSRFLSTYLSPLLLILYQSVVLPHFVYFMVSYEKHIEKSKETVSELKRFLIYNLLYVFFFPIVGLSFMNMVTSIYEEGFSQWKLDVAKSISHSGYFYTTFLIHQTFLTQGFELLSPIRLLHIKIRQWRAVSDEEKDLAYRASEYLWAYHYAQSLTNFVIVSSIAIVYPIILPIGLMYFVVKMMVHKYLMLCVYYIDPKSTGNRLFKSILTCLIVAILIFHLITASQLIICGFETVRIFGIVVSVLSIVLLVFSIKKIHALIKMIKKQVTNESVMSVSEPLMNSDPREYIHPIEKRFRGFPTITPLSSSLN